MADAPATTTEEPNDFDSAFGKLTLDDAAPVVKKEEPAAGAASTEGTTIEIEGALPDPKAVNADGTTKPAEGAAPVADPPKPANDTKPADGAAPADDLLDRFRTILREEVKPTPAGGAAPEPKVEQKPVVEAFTPEQQAAVDAYIKDFPDVYVAEQLIRKQEYQAFANWMFDQIRPHIEALRGQTTQLAVSSHVDQLHAAVPDYDEVVPKVQEWIGKQPDYLKDAYTAVAQRGSTQQVVDLIGRYRAEMGMAAPAAAAGGEKPAAGGAPVADPPKPEVDPKKEKILQGLAPVGSKRSGVASGGISADDFDGAFSAFAKAS